MRNVLVCLFLVTAFSAGVLALPADDFAGGNKLFQEKEYGKAIDLYTKVLAQGVESAPLYYNLGNAYFKNGNLGNAVLYYLRARRLDPSDDDIRSNLEFARSLSTVQLEGTQLNPVNSLMDSLVAPYRLNQMAWLSSLLFIGFVGLLVIRFGFGWFHVALKPATILLVVLLVLASFFTSYKYHHDFVTRWAVVIQNQAEVRSGPTDTADLEFQGEPGLVVRINGESGDYYDVVFENQRRGWIKKSLLAEV